MTAEGLNKVCTHCGLVCTESDPCPRCGYLVLEIAPELTLRGQIATALGVIGGVREVIGDAAMDMLLDAHQTIICADQSIVRDVQQTVERRS